MYKSLKSLIVYIAILFLSSCEPAIEYIEIEKEVLVTETVLEEVIIVETVTEEIEVTKEVIVIEEVEVVITKYIDVIEYIDKEVITEVEVIEYVDVEVETVITETVIEYVDRTETITEYVDKIETIIEYIEVESDPIVQIVEKDVIIDNIVNTETIVYFTKEIFIMEEQEVVIEPIKEYDNYITTENKVRGVVAGGFEEIPLIKGLFKIGETLFFTIDELFYSQENGTITEIEESEFPEVPRSEHIEFESGVFKVQKAMYNETPISKVYNGTSNVAYMQVDGACLRGSDLIYSVSISYGTTPSGIYLWTVNGNPQLQTVLGEGRIW
jgi:hypothetical protein